MAREFTDREIGNIERFYNLNLAAKQANLEATSQTNAMFEAMSSEISRLNDIIKGLESTVADQGEEIEAQVKIIIDQKNEITKRN